MRGLLPVAATGGAYRHRGRTHSSTSECEEGLGMRSALSMELACPSCRCRMVDDDAVFETRKSAGLTSQQLCVLVGNLHGEFSSDS